MALYEPFRLIEDSSLWKVQVIVQCMHEREKYTRAFKCPLLVIVSLVSFNFSFVHLKTDHEY